MTKKIQIKHEKFEINGWVAFDKPLEMSSTFAVAYIRRLFKAKKGGHAGTLDPLATGILPIALGEATKTVPYVMEGGQKAYRFTVRWGAETNTDDLEGTITQTSETRPSRAQVEALLPQFIGRIQQQPPQFSAIKINGERAYDLARAGETVEIAAREVEILTLTIQSHTENETVFETECGKGTYVRAIARDFGRLLGCYGHIITLRRTRVGPFNEENVISQAALEELVKMDLLQNALLPVQAGLQEVDELRISLEMAARLRQGQNVLLRGSNAPLEGHVWASHNGELVALCDILQGALEPRRVFSY
jgi:tRNA pseudouridine55 synthase